MNYTLNQLRVFLKVAHFLSITKAAEELHLTQPAVSIQLKNFQDQFDIPLIEVINKKLYLTDFGKEIAAAAENILNEVYAINDKMLAHKGFLTGKLKFSVVSTGKYIAPYFIADFLKQYPNIELQMDVTNKMQVLSSLEKNEIDFAFVSVLPENIKISSVELLENKLVLVGNSEKVFEEEKYDKALLENIPLIYREPGSGTRHVMERFMLQNDLTVRKKLELTSNEAVKQAVIAGLGYSIMPMIGLKNELENQQLRVIPIEGFPITSTWTLIWLQDKKLSAVARAYLAYVLREKEQIIQTKFGWY